MFETPRRIDLTLPTAYNRCTIPQLRAIASVIIDLSAQADQFHPMSMDDVKAASFFMLANLEIVSPLNADAPINEQFYMVRFRHNRIKTLFNKIMRRNEPFPLYLWQITSWLGKRTVKGGRTLPGLLDWMDTNSKQYFTICPFKVIKRRKGFFRVKAFRGPYPMLDGFSWQRYRFSQDYMKNYMDQSNYLVRLQQMGKKVSPDSLLKAAKQVDRAKALFLANIFNERIDYTDEDTGLVRHDWHYQFNQSFDNVDYFLGFPDVDWQIILLWWSGIMAWLGSTYPKVFKVQPTKGNSPQQNPLELYARTTATIEKYVGLNADEVEREPYTAVLQQMQDIATQNEEIDKMRAKHKPK